MRVTADGYGDGGALRIIQPAGEGAPLTIRLADKGALPGCRGRGPSLLDFGQGEAIPVTEVGSRRSSSMTAVRPNSAAAMAAVATARCKWRADHGVDRSTAGEAVGGGLGLPGSAGAKREVAQSAEAVLG
jgi:hypothetical protein